MDLLLVLSYCLANKEAVRRQGLRTPTADNSRAVQDRRY